MTSRGSDKVWGKSGGEEKKFLWRDELGMRRIILLLKDFHVGLDPIFYGIFQWVKVDFEVRFLFENGWYPHDLCSVRSWNSRNFEETMDILGNR